MACGSLPGGFIVCGGAYLSWKSVNATDATCLFCSFSRLKGMEKKLIMQVKVECL